MNQSLVQTGTVGATPVMTDVSFIGCDVAVQVIIGGTDYVCIHPPGYPVKPQNTGIQLGEPGTFTFTAGSTVALLRCEAAALVTAGFASYA